MQFFADLMNRLDTAEDQDAVVHVATRVYGLYRDVFRALPAFAATSTLETMA